MSMIIQTAASSIEATLDFYKTLGFTIRRSDNNVYALDNQTTIELNPDKNARIGIKLFKTDWNSEIKKISGIEIIRNNKNSFLLTDPSGVIIHLVEDDQPTFPGKDTYPQSIPGNYAGVSIESINITSSTLFWQALGYRIVSGSEDQGWVTLTNDNSDALSLIRYNISPHQFTNPSLTYFNGAENLAIINRVRESGIPIKEEITAFNKEGIVDNIIVHDPGGLGFFIFND